MPLVGTYEVVKQFLKLRKCAKSKDSLHSLLREKNCSYIFIILLEMWDMLNIFSIYDCQKHFIMNTIIVPYKIGSLIFLLCFLSDSPVASVAVCAGAGTSVLAGVPADLLVTGEMPHHVVLVSLF